MILKTISSDGAENNTLLGRYYRLIKKGCQQFDSLVNDTYGSLADAWRNEVSGFVISDMGSNVTPLMSGNQNAIYWKDGTIFERV